MIFMNCHQKRHIGGAARENAIKFVSQCFGMHARNVIRDSGGVKAGKAARLASPPLLLLVHLLRLMSLWQSSMLELTVQNICVPKLRSRVYQGRRTCHEPGSENIGAHENASISKQSLCNLAINYRYYDKLEAGDNKVQSYAGEPRKSLRIWIKALKSIRLTYSPSPYNLRLSARTGETDENCDLQQKKRDL